MAWATFWVIFFLKFIWSPRLWYTPTVIERAYIKVFFQEVQRCRKKLSIWVDALQPGLPDGLFSSQKSIFGSIWVGLGMENVVKLYDHFEYFTAIWYILWQIGIVCTHLVHCSHFGMFGPRKIWQHWLQLCTTGFIISPRFFSSTCLGPTLNWM
jgi:hypothetical protein